MGFFGSEFEKAVRGALYVTAPSVTEGIFYISHIFILLACLSTA